MDFTLTSIEDIVTFLEEGWEKYAQDGKAFDNLIVQEKIAQLAGITDDEMDAFLKKTTLISLGQHLGLDGFLSREPIKKEIYTVDTGPFDKEKKEVPVLDKSTPLSSWNQPDFLLLQLYFIVERYVKFKHGNDSLSSELNGKITSSDYKQFLKQEIKLTLNAYELRVAYEKILTEHQGDTLQRDSFICSLAENYLTKVLASDSEEFCLPCGSKTHSEYLILEHDKEKRQLILRIDNSSREEPILFKVNTEQVKFKEQLVGYLKEVMLGLLQEQRVQADILHEPNQRYSLIESVPQEKANYPALSAQTVGNCVVAGFRRGCYYRAYAKNKNDELFRVLLNKEKLFTTKAKDKPTEFESYIKRKQDKIQNQEREVSSYLEQKIEEMRDNFFCKNQQANTNQALYYYYVPPQAQSSLQVEDDEHRFDLESRVREVLLNDTTSASTQVLLLLGDSGAGKSLFCQHLEKVLWDTYEPGHRVPVRIELRRVQQDGVRNCVDKTFQDAGFNEAAIAKLRRERRFLFLLDGYDEIGGSERRDLYADNHLQDWAAKVLITCRTQYLSNFSRYKHLFTPSQGKQSLVKYYMSPFDDIQIQRYLSDYTAFVAQDPQARGAITWDAATYLSKLKSIPGLFELVTSPLLLKIVIKVLPKLTTLQPQQRMTRTRVYDTFIAKWFGRALDKIKECSGVADDCTITSFADYAERLAFAMYQQDVSEVYYQPPAAQGRRRRRQVNYDWSEFFSNDTPAVVRQRSACPLRLSGDDRYSFIHKSFMEYFCATHIYNDLQLKEFSTLEDVYSKRSPVDVSGEDFTENTLGELQTLAINERNKHQKLLTAEPGILQFLRDKITGDTLVQSRLLQIVQLSRDNPSVATAAAHVMTVLNYARVSFSGLDLSAIHIPDADLSGAILDATKLTKADLSHVRLVNAFLKDTDLKETTLTGVRLTESRYWELESSVTCMVYSLDAQQIAIGDSNGIILLRSAEGEELYHTLCEHTKQINCLIYCEGTQLASASDDKTVRLWNTSMGKLQHTLEHDDKVRCVAYNPDGTQLASASDDKTVRLWDTSTGERQHTLEHDDKVRYVVYNPEGTQLASASDDKTVRLWDTSMGKLQHTLKHDGKVRCVVYNPEGTQLASASDDKTVRLWDASMSKLQHTLKHDGKVRCVAYNPNGTQLASASDDKTIRLWSANGAGEPKQPQHILSDDNKDTVTSLGYDFSAEQQALENQDTFLSFMNQHFSRLVKRATKMMRLAYRPNGKQLVTAMGKTVYLWNVITGHKQHTFPNEPTDVISVAYRPIDGAELAIACSKTVKLLEVPTDFRQHNLSGHAGVVMSLAYSPDGTQLASADNNGKVCLWEVATGRLQHTLSKHDRCVWSVAYCSEPKGVTELASASEDATVCLWDTSKGTLLRTLAKSGGYVMSVAYSPDGKQLASASQDGKLYLWEVATVEEPLALQHEESVVGVAYHPKGAQLASTTNDGFLSLWDICTAPPERSFFKNTHHSLGTIAYRPSDGLQLVSIGSEKNNKTVCLWDVETGTLQHTLAQHTADVNNVSYSGSGQEVASASNDTTVRLWDTKTGRCLTVLTGHHGAATALCYAPGSDTLLATAGDDSSVRHWVYRDIPQGKKKWLLVWSSHDYFFAEGCQLDDAKGLSFFNQCLLQQYGAQHAVDKQREAISEQDNQLGVKYIDGEGVASIDSEALKWFHKAAEQNNAGGQYHLGVMYATGRGVEQSDEEAVKWYRKAVEQEYAAAQCHLGFMYATGRGVEQSDEEAVKWYRKAAGQGDARAQYNLGVMYATGRGVEQSDEEAVKWYRKAVGQGDARAQYNLGVMYETGKGVEQSDEEAVKWYRKAAKQGHARAQFHLGYRYNIGKGVKQQSDKTAVKWYRKAAKQGDAAAQCNLGVMYEMGKGVAPSDEEAVKWYRKAAEQEYAVAQCNLGVMYETGKGIEQSDEEAMEWYRQAAEQEYAAAQCNLGFMYETGKGVEPSDEESVKWYRQAAKQGHARAQFHLGCRYETGKGIEQSDEEAVKWYHQAAEQGDVYAQHNLGGIYLTRLGNASLGKEWTHKAAEQDLYAAIGHMGLFYERGIGGVSQDVAKALSCYEQAAKDGYPFSQLTLGVLYLLNNGVLQDIAQAEELFEKIVQPSDFYQNCSYGNLIIYLKKLANEKDLSAVLALAVVYQRGLLNEEKDLGKAYEYYNIAAQQKIGYAETQLTIIAQQPANSSFNTPLCSLFQQVLSLPTKTSQEEDEQATKERQERRACCSN